MKKYKYTIEFVTPSTSTVLEQRKLAEALHGLIVEGAPVEVYAKVSFEKPVKMNKEELKEFKLNAGYDLT